MAVCKSYVGYYISMDVIVALMFDKRLGTARFLRVKPKASSNAFPIYRSSSLSFHHKASALFRKRCKDSAFFFNYDGKGTGKYTFFVYYLEV